MSPKSTNTKVNFVSDADRFLMEFDKKAEASSATRKAEEAKYQRIDELRDNAKAPRDKKKLWQGF